MERNDVLVIFILCLMFTTTGFFLSRWMWRDSVYPAGETIAEISLNIPLGNLPEDADTYSIKVRLENLPSWDGSNWDARWIDYGYGDAVIDYSVENIKINRTNRMYHVEFKLYVERVLTAEIVYYKTVTKSVSGATGVVDVKVGSFYFSQRLNPRDYI